LTINRHNRYTKSRCISISRFRAAIGNDEQYTIAQSAQAKGFKLADTIADCGSPSDPENSKKWKTLFKQSIPDQYKRQVLLFFFNLTQLDAAYKYKMIKE